MMRSQLPADPFASGARRQAGPSLAELFGTGDAELAANRAGRLGPRQQQRFRRTAIARAAIGVAFLAFCLFAGGLTGYSADDPSSFWFAILGAVVAAGFAVAAWSVERARHAPVERRTGPITVSSTTTTTADGAAHRQLHLRVDGVTCRVAAARNASTAHWQDAFTGVDYALYLVSTFRRGAPIAVAAEPVGAGT